MVIFHMCQCFEVENSTRITCDALNGDVDYLAEFTILLSYVKFISGAGQVLTTKQSYIDKA